MFEKLEMAPPDPILGLTEAFNEDPNPAKINLGVGVYKDASGQTPIFTSVKKAEQKILRQETTKSYLPISGTPAYAGAVQTLVFGPASENPAAGRAATVQTPGGTGALRIAGDFLAKVCGIPRIWLSNPTWENHLNIFRAAGLAIDAYPYYDAENKSLNFPAMIEAVRHIPHGEAILVHGCCHNPSGIDPDLEQWKEIAATAAERRLAVVVDLAYQGLGDGLDTDTLGVRALCDAGGDLLIASSFSKNFGLYRERVGALTAVAGNAEAAQKALSHLKATIRANYSNPPSHGAAIVTAILEDSALRAEWEKEVTDIRERIHLMRRLFVETMKAKNPARDFSFITGQKGMFSFSGLSREQVGTLRQKDAVYIVGSGRINVAGMTADNMDALCQAIAGVL